MIRVAPRIVLDERELEESFVRSSGPGGQNVNKVETAVQLRFDAMASPGLPEDVKDRLRGIAGSRMTTDGVVILKPQRFRKQDRKRSVARERVVELLLQGDGRRGWSAVRRNQRSARRSDDWRARRVEDRSRSCGRRSRPRTDRAGKKLYFPGMQDFYRIGAC